MSVKKEVSTTPAAPTTQARPDLSHFLKVDLNEIGNKAKKAELRARLKNEKAKLYKQYKKQKLNTDQTEQPKKIPKTIENQRQRDNTYDIDPNDTDYVTELSTDEFNTYFQQNNNLIPRTIITSNQRYLRKKSETYQLVLCLLHMIPNTTFYQRQNYTIQQIVDQAMLYSEQQADTLQNTHEHNNSTDNDNTENELAPNQHTAPTDNDVKSEHSNSATPFTDILILNENEYKVNGLTHIHLPSGPTIFYSLRSLKLPKQLGITALPTDYKPEIILNNFDSILGQRVSRMVTVLFNRQPEFVGRRVVTFHNQRDYIFVRQHRYIFGNNKHGETKAKLQEIGPRFTLKVKWLQSGIFDTIHGQYEYIRKNDTESHKRTFRL